MKILSLCLLLVTACTHAPLRQPTGLAAGTFWKLQNERRQGLASLSAKLRLRYETKKESVAGKGRFVSDLPRNLLLELRDPLGRLQYLTSLDNEKFTAVYPSENRAFLDSEAGKAYLKKFLGFPFSFRDLAELLTGVVPSAVMRQSFDTWEWVAGEGVYRGTAKSGGSTVTCDVDADTAALRALSWKNGPESVHIGYDDFFPCCRQASGNGFRVAGLVSVRLEKTDSKIEVEWEEITPFRAPKGTDLFKVKLDAKVQQIPLH